jgi:adenylosuccinate lyase
MQAQPLRTDATRPQGGATKAQAAAPQAGGASFQALLEKLEQHVEGLSGRTLDEPGQLSGVVGEARASLDAAMDLGRDLLEAYREARLGT